jgi:CheY-like chemotaxis protein
LPGIDGVELTRRIKATPGLAKSSVILMSAYGEPRQHDGDAFLPKPFDVSELGEIITPYLTPSHNGHGN